MPQINLLTNETKRQVLPWEMLLTLLVRVFIIAFIALLGYYGYLIFRSKTSANKILATQNSIIQTQNEILKHQDRKELLVRQGQLTELSKLVAGHPYWSRLFPELSKVTLKNAYYLGMSAESKGTAKMTVIVPSYTDFDNFLQVFDLKEFNDQFSNVRLIAVTKYQVGEISGIKFDIELTLNTAFIKGLNSPKQ